MGITQAELARESGVSLPTVQSIEAGRANPALDTIESLLGSLALNLNLSRRAADWDALAACGAPLSTPGAAGSRRGAPRASRALLLRTLREACLELAGQGEVEDRERKTEAVQALLMALQGHFPSLFARYGSAPVFSKFAPPKEPSGRLIKLKRQAAARLATYL